MHVRPFFLIPVIAVAMQGQSFADDQSILAVGSGRHWSDSLTKEKDKNYDEALEETLAFLREGGDALLGNERTGWLKYLKGDQNGAEQAYSNANKMMPSAITPLLGLLNVAKAQKDPKKIERAAQAVLRLTPSNYNAQMAIAAMYFEAKDYNRAASQYQRVLTLYPDDVDVMSGEAWSYYYLGYKREANELFRTIVNVIPDYLYAQRGIELTTKSVKESSANARPMATPNTPGLSRP